MPQTRVICSINADNIQWPIFLLLSLTLLVLKAIQPLFCLVFACTRVYICLVRAYMLHISIYLLRANDLFTVISHLALTFNGKCT